MPFHSNFKAPIIPKVYRLHILNPGLPFTRLCKPAHHLAAYNAQIVVDDKEKLMVATAVLSQGNDAQALHQMGLVRRKKH